MKRAKPIRLFRGMSAHQLRQRLLEYMSSLRTERRLRQIMEAEWNTSLTLLEQALRGKATLEHTLAARGMWLPSYVPDVEIDDAIEAALL